MATRRKKKPADLALLADRVNTALTTLRDAGFHDEVRAIRDFIHAEGDFYRESIRTNQQVFTELNRQLVEAQRKQPNA